jgi:hypothetical protein
LIETWRAVPVIASRRETLTMISMSCPRRGRFLTLVRSLEVPFGWFPKRRLKKSENRPERSRNSK